MKALKPNDNNIFLKLHGSIEHLPVGTILTFDPDGIPKPCKDGDFIIETIVDTDKITLY